VHYVIGHYDVSVLLKKSFHETHNADDVGYMTFDVVLVSNPTFTAVGDAEGTVSEERQGSGFCVTVQPLTYISISSPIVHFTQNV
jgi:hypothetical protein